MQPKRSVRTIRLYGAMLWQRSIAAVAQYLVSKSSNPLTVQLTNDVAYPFHSLWQRLGRSVSHREKRRKFIIELPGAGRFYAAAHPELTILPLEQAKWFEAVFGEERLQALGASGAADAEPLLLLELERPTPRHDAPAPEQLVTSLCRILATLTVALRLVPEEIRRRETLLSAGSGGIELFASIAPLRADLGVLTEALLLYSRFLRALRWEEAFDPLVILKPFLPRGSWPVGSNAAGASEPEPPVLSRCEVLRGDERLHPERDAFYRQLGCRVVLEPALGSSFHQRRYVAYVFIAGSGERVAILDTAVKENAAYLFRIGGRGDEADGGWVGEAQLTKRELVYSGAPRQHFLGRVIHSAGWQRRIEQALAMA